MGVVVKVMLWGGEDEPSSMTTSVAARDFVRRLCERDVDRRPDAAEALKHCWISRGRRDRVMSFVMDEDEDEDEIEVEGGGGGDELSTSCSSIGGLRYYLRTRQSNSSGSFVS